MFRLSPLESRVYGEKRMEDVDKLRTRAIGRAKGVIEDRGEIRCASVQYLEYLFLRLSLYRYSR